MLNGLDLFSGIGGLTLALKHWVTPVAYCEIDPYCQAILLNRQADGTLPYAPIWDDIRTFPCELFTSGIDCVYGGFPCQDISVAGNGKGLEGKRSGLFFEVIRLVREIRPRFLFLENVPAILVRGGERIVREITASGYDCRWTLISAAGCGAPHIRERWWLLAYANNQRLEARQCGPTKQAQGAPVERRSWWDVEPDVGRVANGIPYRVDRIKALGNAVVPQCAEEAFKRLMGLDLHQVTEKTEG